MLNLGIATNTVETLQSSTLNPLSNPFRKHVLILVALVSWLHNTSIGFSARTRTDYPAEFSYQEPESTNRTRTIMESAQKVGPAILADTFYIDTLASITITALITGSVGVWAIPAAAGPALVGYTFRKICNDQLNPGENNALCGIIGGSFKGLAVNYDLLFKMMSNPTYGGLLASLVLVGRESLDGALYETFLPYMIPLMAENSYFKATGISGAIEVIGAWGKTYGKYLAGDESIMGKAGSRRPNIKRVIGSLEQLGAGKLAAQEGIKALAASIVVTALIGTFATAHSDDFKPLFEETSSEKDEL